MNRFILKLKIFLITFTFCQYIFLPLQAETFLEKGNAEKSSFEFLSFSVFVREKAAVIAWKTNKDNANLVLYRSSEPFNSAASLINAIPIANIEDRGLPFLDFPIPGIPYYYAILEESELAFGNIKFIHGKNTFNKPIEIINSESEQISEFKIDPRPMPLPYLNFKKKTENKPKYFSTSTESIIAALSSENPIYKEYKRPAEKRSMTILPEEENSQKGGEALALQDIILNYFTARKWEKCETELKKFLSMRRTEKINYRTHFYLGQIYFFTGRYEKALMEFLYTKDLYPNISQEWIQYCLSELHKKNS